MPLVHHVSKNIMTLHLDLYRILISVGELAVPRELCLVGCVFYIADYYGEVTTKTVHTWKRLVHQHGGEVSVLWLSLESEISVY